jgi:hypothetical protein
MAEKLPRRDDWWSDLIVPEAYRDGETSEVQAERGTDDDDDDDVVIIEDSSNGHAREGDHVVIIKDVSNEPATSRPSSPGSGEFDIAKWFEEEEIGALPNDEAVRRVRAKHAALLQQKVWSRCARADGLNSSRVKWSDGVRIRVYHVSTPPRMDVKRYPSFKRFFIDLAACLLHASAASTKGGMVISLARALDGVAFIVSEMCSASEKIHVRIESNQASGLVSFL